MAKHFFKLAVVPAILALAACSDGGSSSGILVSTSEQNAAAVAAKARPLTAQCATPLPPSVVNQTLTVNIPTDVDPTANPQPQSTIAFSLLLPKRCPGDQFPLVLQSHGYGGNRLKTIAPNGELPSSSPHFPSIDGLVQALPHHGYVVISFDERGHGDSTGASARIIDPNAEVQDARRILDWAFDNAAQYNIETLPKSGIAKDLNVGTIGYSYGGGFEMPLAALDARIKTIVPNGTWNDLLYSLLPGNGVKLSFDGLLCLLATTASTSAMPNTGVNNTPLVAALCNTVGVQGLFASTLRSRTELQDALASPLTLPRPVQASEIDPFFGSHSTSYFERQQAASQPWGFGETQAKLRPVPALFLQGNRDTLFNMNDAYWNARYFKSTGADVRLLTTEGGHMNPLANQLEGTANCGAVNGLGSILAWFDKQLKQVDSANFNAIPKVCISVADTVGTPKVTPVGLRLNDYPVGSLSGRGAIPTKFASLGATVALTAVSPVFLPVTTISGDNQVLAGSPRLSKITVTPEFGALRTAVAYVGVGIHRAGKLILVDDMVTAFAAGEHTTNRAGIDNAVLLPGVGERLQKGDVVGLLLYQQHVQYSAVVSAASLPNATNLANTALGLPIPPVASALDTSAIALPNPYSIRLIGVELPILVPGLYPGSSLSQ
ncbi:MAG: CocE/NonD family hydrolase [Pseudomonadota bacterium]